MTAHLAYACQEIDEQLLECLLTWSEAAGQGRESAQLAPVHAHYGQRSSSLIEARTAIEAAIRALDEETADTEASDLRKHSVQSEVRDQEKTVHVTVDCHCADVEWRMIHVEGSSSRPDRPQRQKERCRGQIRDWNRDILACRPMSASLPVSMRKTTKRQSGIGGVNKESTETAEIDLDAAISMGRTEAASEYAIADPGDVELTPQQPEETFVKEPENGTQSKSTRSRKRG
ncbi:hypothetical protein [Labrenzia sp. PHM005]|uniref:hypothetical protein n=1 Tax=Labrenzia sp. PHM005 TaxID=2590016 RepID=UPI00113FEDA2|nr:hypothetical protein [Labrenzia sp. PHM005]QDG76724.1 hypothetical protein FJ695_13045 [Labrenzia sp. PHM005]